MERECVIKGEVVIDHVHLLLSIPSKMGVSGVKGCINGKNSFIVYQNTEQRSINADAESFGVAVIM